MTDDRVVTDRSRGRQTPRTSASISAQRTALSASPARACCGVQCARVGSPGGTVEMFYENLVHAIVGGEDPD